MAIDPTIEAVFGAAPDGMNLSASTTSAYDIISCVVLGIAAASVALRFYIRTMYNTQAKNLGVDDYTILLGLVSTFPNPSLSYSRTNTYLLPGLYSCSRRGTTRW